MDKLELSQGVLALLVFIFQIGFLYLRTHNIRYTAEGHILGAMATSFGVGLLWLVSVTIGVTSLTKGELLPIVAHLIGGVLGTYIGMRQKHGDDGVDLNALMWERYPDAEVGDVRYCAEVSDAVTLDKNGKWVKT